MLAPDRNTVRRDGCSQRRSWVLASEGNTGSRETGNWLEPENNKKEKFTF